MSAGGMVIESGKTGDGERSECRYCKKVAADALRAEPGMSVHLYGQVWYVNFVCAYAFTDDGV